jgi:hypothetical protein
MAAPRVGSSLRRLCAPTGAVALLCLVLAAQGLGATPSPDPPPVAVTPEAPRPERASKPAPVLATPVTAPRVVVSRPSVNTRRAATPAARRSVSAKPKPAKVRPTPKPAAVVRTSPHDQALVRLPAAADVADAVDRFDRGLLAFAGAGLAVDARGGAVVLLAARRDLKELARRATCGAFSSSS